MICVWSLWVTVGCVKKTTQRHKTGGCCPSILMDLNLHTVEVFAHSDQLITNIISSSEARLGALNICG